MTNGQTQESVFAADPDENDQIQAGSAVIRVNDTHRECHLASILPYSEEADNGSRQPIDFRVYYEAAGYLAMKHFNERDPRVLPHLPERLKDCNVQLSMEMRDTRFSPIYAARQLQEILRRQHSPSTPWPIALVGAARSAVSQTLSILAGVYELPQVSASSTSSALDNKASSPFFARTVPTNQGDAKATILYLQSLGVTHMGVIYIRDEFGTSFNSQILEEANKVGMQVLSTSFDADRKSIVTGIKLLQESGFAYFMGIFNPETWEIVVREAFRAGIIGSPDYVWLLSDASQELAQPGFVLNRKTEADLASAIDGTGVVLLAVEPNSEFDKALSELQTNTEMQQNFVAAHDDPSVFDGYNFRSPGSALYQYLNYDAVMALGIAACEAPSEFFTGPELYETLLQTEFVGVSGLVRFANDTGTRDVQGLLYHIENVRIAENQTSDEDFTFNSVTASKVNFSDATPVNTANAFVYAGGSTLPPPPLPPLNVELNLITRGIRITGLLLGCVSMLCAVCWLIWTIYYRNKDVVRIAQPIFLCQLCVGAFIMATAVIPMSMQETVTSPRGLDIACMATPWLLSMGFVTAFSALFSKTWRLNKVRPFSVLCAVIVHVCCSNSFLFSFQLFRNGKGFRRVKVKARDVILPFVILTGLNVILLTLWTVVAPMEWTRRWTADFDEYGRSVESYGTCYGGRDDVAQYVFMALILLVDIAAIVFALYQSYRARNLPTDFNESYYVSIATFSLLESMILGGPLLVLVRDNPSADFLIKSLLVTFVCSTILLFMFIPKYLQRNLREMRTTQGKGRAHRRMASRITAGNRFPSFSPEPGGHGSSSGGHGSVSSVPNVSLGGRSSVGSATRGSLELSQKVLGQSTICRSEDYFLQRRSVETLKKRRVSIFRRSRGVEQHANTSSFPETNAPAVDSANSGNQGSNVVSLNIAAFDSPPAKLQLPFDSIRESMGSTDVEKSIELGDVNAGAGESTVSSTGDLV